jgi:3-isopropylmalate dehydrogenase
MAKITLIPGDGIGPEIVAEAVKVLDAVAQKFGRQFITETALAGGAAIDDCGFPLPKETVDLCRQSDAVLLGAVGGPKWDALPVDRRPEKAILGLRKELGLFGNLRPVKLYPALSEASPLKASILANGIDLLIVRELTGGIYFGPRERVLEQDQAIARDTEVYATSEIQRIADLAFRLATQRSNRVMSVDKANVLESSRLWRETVQATAAGYPGVELEHMYVDNCAMQLILNPNQFDVLVTSNMFGDILSDEASVLTGSIGMLPSASLRHDSFGLYEPSHGSAPDIAGKNIANPLATILSLALLFRFSLQMAEEADAIENAVEEVLQEGYRTIDLARNSSNAISTSKMGDLIVEKILKRN